MDYAGKATGLGDCRRIVERDSVARCDNWAPIDPPKAVIRSRLLRGREGLSSSGPRLITGAGYVTRIKRRFLR
jgi:hypothetical protein